MRNEWEANPSLKRRGFTLVELLVVIGIMSVLISVLLPALNKARQAAQTVACASNMRQVMLGLLMYAQDNRGSIPFSYHDNPYTIWAGAIGGGPGRYLRDSRVFLCPARLDAMKNTELAGKLKNLETDPNGAHSSLWAYVSYCINRYGAAPAFPTPTSHAIRFGEPGAPASSLLVLTEGWCPVQLQPGGEYYGWYEMPVGNASYKLIPHRGGSINCGFLDGHCAALPAAELGWDAPGDKWLAKAATDWTWKAGAPWYEFQYAWNTTRYSW